jgi:hypothetical protein
MANRYWVGGAGTWNTTSTTNWSDTSGGAGGFSVPTVADSVFFDQAGTYTVTMTGALACLDITVSAGTVTFATGTSPTLNVRGSMSLRAGTVWAAVITITFSATTTGQTITTNGVTLTNGVIVFDGVGGQWTLGSNLTTSNSLTLTAGTFDTSSTNNYQLSVVTISSSGTIARTLNLNSSTVNVTSFLANTTTNFTFNAGNSQLNFISSSSTLSGSASGLTFYNVSFTASALGTRAISGVNTFNNLTFASRVSAGIYAISIGGNQTVNGTLTLSNSGVASSRQFITSSVVGTQRTLTVNALAAGAADYDFKDIAITGAAAPIAPTRAGDCKGNSGITFPAAKTVYYRQTGSANWGVTGTGSWSLTSGGALDPAAFPLAQDTAIFPAATYPASGSVTTINADYNIGTIDMNLRTSNTMTLAMGASVLIVYGNWVNGTGITISGVGSLSFQGRGTQTITSAGRSFTQNIGTISPGGSVTLLDALTTTSTTQSGMSAGTFDANGYNYTAVGFSSSNTGVRTIAIGSGTWTLNGTGNAWNTAIRTNLTVTGTGTISLTNAGAKTFAGGGVATYPTLNQGGTGTLTISGANTFADITNTAIGNITFPASTTTSVSAFNVSGNSTTRVQLRSSFTGAGFTLSKSSGTVSVDWLDIRDSFATGGATWNAGANSLNTGNNLGWIFGTSTTHATSGGLIGQGTTLAGSAARLRTFATSGALIGQGTTLAGSAARFRTFATSGALNGPGSTINGSAVRFRAFATTGTLNGQGTIINGSATRFRAFVSSGALDGQGAAVAGSAARFRVFATTGVLDGQGAAIVGSATRLRAFNATGSLFGQGAALSGVASRIRYFTASGALLGPGAAVNGNASRLVTHFSTGALVGPGSAIVGVSNHISLYPDPADVREGVQYGPGGIYVGTLTVGSGRSIIRLRSFTEEGS